MTPEKEKAIAERAAFYAATPNERKKYGSVDKMAAAMGGTSSRASGLRGRLLLAGDRADIFWQRIEAGMPLTTAVDLLRESELAFRARSESRSIDEVIAEVLARYENTGHVRTSADGKVFRTRGTLQERAARIAKGEAAPRATNGSGKPGTRAAIREACAAWVAQFVSPDDPRTDALTADVLREIEVVLESFSNRLRPSEVSKKHLHAACDRLNIPRPRWGQRADQERAWKHRKAALRATHPDALGHDGGREAFQSIKDAYDVLVAYNDGLLRGAGASEGGA